jgi:CheY-like chemotaxis protein
LTERVRLTRADLRGTGGRALCEEYAIREDDEDVIVSVSQTVARRFDLGEVYAQRHAEQCATAGRAQRNVLVVDDEEVIRSLIGQLLARRGLAPDTAVDGEHAIEKLRSGAYAVMLLDLMLPKLSGFEVLELMRRERIFLPVIVVSGAGERRTRELDPYLVTAVVRKPFDIDVLAAIAAALVSGYVVDAASSNRAQHDQ